MTDESTPEIMAKGPADANAEVKSKAEMARLRVAQTMDPLVPQSEVDTLRAMLHLAEIIAPTEFVPRSLRNSAPKVLAAIMRGRELGLKPMSSLQHISIIEGAPALSAELQLAAVLARGHSIVGGSTATKAELTGTRCDNHDTITVIWTMERAEQAGLAQKDTYKRYPEKMLYWRAATELCSRLFPDCLVGFGGGWAEEPIELAVPQR